MKDDDLLQEFEKEKKSLKSKYIFIIIVVAIFSAVISSEYTLFVQNKQPAIEKINA